MIEIRARGVHAVSIDTLFMCPGSPRCLFTGYELGNLFSSVSWSSAGACGFREGTVDKVYYCTG